MLFALLFFLLAAHVLMDFALQNEITATCKCRGSDHPVAKIVPWYYWLTAHALLHGAATGVVIRWFGYDWPIVAALALAETITHWLIDHAKCLGWFGIHTDQCLHLLSKLLWLGLIASGAFGTLAS
jgi:hypothetical protein